MDIATRIPDVIKTCIDLNLDFSNDYRRILMNAGCTDLGSVSYVSGSVREGVVEMEINGKRFEYLGAEIKVQIPKTIVKWTGAEVDSTRNDMPYSLQDAVKIALR